MKIYSYAKLNLSLEVYAPTGGYHPLCSIFQTISLHDTLIISLNTHDRRIRLRCNHPQVPTDSRNILVKIFEALQLRIPVGLDIALEKNIPIGGGLGGGSANAAAFLAFLNQTFQWGYSITELAKLGAEFGTDIPFFFIGGSACVQGIGEVVTPLSPGKHRYFLLINPGIEVSSAQAYRGLDEEGGLIAPGGIPKEMVDERVGFNRFKPWLWKGHPLFAELEEALKQQGANALYLSGSGGTTFLPFFEESEALKWEALVTQMYPHYWVRCVQGQPLGYAFV